MNVGHGPHSLTPGRLAETSSVSPVMTLDHLAAALWNAAASVTPTKSAVELVSKKKGVSHSDPVNGKAEWERRGAHLNQS